MILFESMKMADFVRAPKGTIAIYEVAVADMQKCQVRLHAYAAKAGATVTVASFSVVGDGDRITKLVKATVKKQGAPRSTRGRKAA